MGLYPKNMKNRNFDKDGDQDLSHIEAAQLHEVERCRLAQRLCQPMQSKTDFSCSLGITDIFTAPYWASLVTMPIFFERTACLDPPLKGWVKASYLIER